MAVPAATLAFVALACVGSLAVNPDDFRLPQVDPAFTIAEGDEVSAQLADLMPQGEDPWDNTVAHPIESSNFRLYFCLPAYQSLNCCQGDYLRQALEDGTLKSRYVSLPIGHKLDKVASARYDVVYRGLDHVIYRVR